MYFDFSDSPFVWIPAMYKLIHLYQLSIHAVLDHMYFLLWHKYLYLWWDNINDSYWPIGCLLVVYGLILIKDVAYMSVWIKTEVTRQVRFPFSATTCGIHVWCRHDLWCVTQIKYWFPVIEVVKNIHHYIIGKLQWHSNSCEMTDEMWKLI